MTRLVLLVSLFLISHSVSMPAGTAGFDLFRPPCLHPSSTVAVKKRRRSFSEDLTSNSVPRRSVIIRWRTDQAVTSRVLYGNSPTALSSSVATNTTTTEHQMALTGLSPDTS